MTGIERTKDNPIDTIISDWDSVEKPPFGVKIKVRSPAHAELIKQAGIETINAD